jgi:hypothetical protein
LKSQTPRSAPPQGRPTASGQGVNRMRGFRCYMNRARLLFSVAVLAALTGCGFETTLPDTATMPPGALATNGDIDVRSLTVAAFDFGQPLRGQPARAADGIATLDYMGGRLNTAPRWVDMSPLYREQMLHARELMRKYIGISESASSQAVVDTMLALAAAYRADDQAATQRLLTNPIFTVSPTVVTARLADIPLMPIVNAATTHADQFSTDFDT